MGRAMTGGWLWLLRLRWAWYGGGAMLVGLTEVAGIPMPWLPLGALLALGFGSNLGLTALLRRDPEVRAADAVASALGLDVGLFTLALLATGGAYNPFSLLYLVLVVAAVQATRGWRAWALTLWTVVAFAVLFGVQSWELQVPPQTHAEHVSFHLRGMWLAAGAAAAFIAWFVGVQRAEQAALAAALEHERTARGRAERLASLATLAAGAAHEMATPLGTIAVVAAELDAVLAEADVDLDAAREDARLITAEVQRCRDVLDRMAVDAGAARGEAPVAATAEALVAAVRERLRPGAALRTEVAAGLPTLQLPLGSVATAVAGLCDNAVRASAEATEPAALGIAATDGVAEGAGGWVITVRDRGPGIEAATLARIGEPFFSTRPHGEGMGLGVFLAREVARRLGGALHLQSEPGAGVAATMTLPGAANATTEAR
ncbi:MAG: HAMP domain-containing histidine kinase [Deltaproteobacteria bacterium]|nr:HAMP domain-containing histidine kinase [Deltaproteobacteria bacterium]